MSFRDEILALVDNVRNIFLPSQLDLSPHQLTVRVRTWSGGVKGLGVASDSDTALPQKLKVMPLKAEEISSSGGIYEIGDIKVSRITPANVAHTTGLTVAQLKPTITTNNKERIYVLAGPHAGEYSLVELNNFKNFSWWLILRRRSQPSGF